MNHALDALLFPVIIPLVAMGLLACVIGTVQHRRVQVREESQVKLSQMPDRRFDLRLHPTEGAFEATFVQPQSLRVYESSVNGMLSVVLYDRAVGGKAGIAAATRLTRGQAEVLARELIEFLCLPLSYDYGYAHGYDDGHEAAERGAA